MGHKGVSIRKPKRPFSNADIKGYAKGHVNDRTPVQSLVNEKGAPQIGGNLDPSVAKNKVPKKR